MGQAQAFRVDRTRIFDTVRLMLGRGFKPAEVGLLDSAIDAALIPDEPDDPLTCRTALEMIAHEAIVQEWYRDSVGVGTWSVGITSASGHDVDRYKDHPQALDHCLAVYVWLLRERYIPAVLKAFVRPLTEAQFAAALSFHYNTGAILKADWVKSWNVGHTAQAREEIMNWCKPDEIIPRRRRERDLFFDGVWSGDGKATVYPVRKPSYRPDFSNGRRVDVSGILGELLS